ncbi:MAG TPA: glutamine synthetase family protein [Propionibacteriaceae bacterium]|nr:glutamine synthetase family protein [Propionibacteriaceae bacterium]
MSELRNARHLSVHDLRRRINEGDIDTVVIAFTDMQGRLQGERLHAAYFAEHVLDHGTEGPAYLLAVDVDMNSDDRYAMSSPDKAEGNIRLVPDMQTIRLLHHQPGAVMVQCDAVWPDQTPVAQSPRTILKQQLAAALDRGYHVLAGTRLQSMAFQTSYEDAWNAHYRDLASVNQYHVDSSILGGTRIEGLLREIRNKAYAAGMDVESAKGEHNLGQHEIGLSHSDALTIADNHAVFKTMAKEIAAQQGSAITFMAKYDEGQGNSCQIQLSLSGADGSTAFWKNHSRTRVFDSFVAGLLATLYDFTVLYAPNINSYKRFVGGSPAPTAIAWGADDRCAVRLTGDDQYARLVNRVPGGDVNPYLALAAMVAGGFYGLDHDLELGSELIDNVHGSEFPCIPRSLREARQAFAASQVARTAFGDDVVDHYATMADVELDTFDAAVTDWELRRGFERM